MEGITAWIQARISIRTGNSHMTNNLHTLTILRMDMLRRRLASRSSRTLKIMIKCQSWVARIALVPILRLFHWMAQDWQPAHQIRYQ